MAGELTQKAKVIPKCNPKFPMNLVGPVSLKIHCTIDFPVTTLSLLSVLSASSGTNDRMTTVIDTQVNITEGLGQTIAEVKEWHWSVVNSTTCGSVVARSPYLVQLLIKGSRQKM